MDRHFQVCDTRQEMSVAVANEVLARLHECLQEKSRHDYVNIAVAGGFIGSEILPVLVQYSQSIDWTRIRFWWVDERFVPQSSPDRNDSDLIQSVLAFLPGVTWVSMPSDDGQCLDEAAAVCESQWRELTGGQAFDLCVLGMGPDGHIASLFPGHPWSNSDQRNLPVLSVDDSPKPPSRRLTFSMSVITSSSSLILAAAGSEKSIALSHLRQGEDYRQWPVAALMQPDVRHKLTVFIDSDAAHGLLGS